MYEFVQFESAYEYIVLVWNMYTSFLLWHFFSPHTKSYSDGHRWDGSQKKGVAFDWYVCNVCVCVCVVLGTKFILHKTFIDKQEWKPAWSIHNTNASTHLHTHTCMRIVMTKFFHVLYINSILFDFTFSLSLHSHTHTHI